MKVKDYAKDYQVIEKQKKNFQNNRIVTVILEFNSEFFFPTNNNPKKNEMNEINLAKKPIDLIMEEHSVFLFPPLLRWECDSNEMKN